MTINDHKCLGVANLAVITIGPHVNTTNICIDVVIGRTKNEESPVIEDMFIVNQQ